MTGNAAVARGVALCRPELICAYPITPQTAIVESLASMVAEGSLKAEFVNVESEHSALALCYGALTAGIRTFTATSSQGLAYMQEMLHYVSGARVPAVMAVVNRGMSPPWTIWLDHQDSIQARDTGWIQLYVENAQEALDTIVQGYMIAESPHISLPVMVCLDGFVLSHTSEVVEVPSQEAVDMLVPRHNPEHRLDPSDPKVIGFGAPPSVFMEFRILQHLACVDAASVIEDAAARYGDATGRRSSGLLEVYGDPSPEVALVCMGSTAGTVKYVVDELAASGRSVSLVRVRSYRPFPADLLRRHLSGARAVAVLDRDISYGFAGALVADVKAALYGLDPAPPVSGFVGGLGGRDIRPEDIAGIFESCRGGAAAGAVSFVGARW